MEDDTRQRQISYTDFSKVKYNPDDTEKSSMRKHEYYIKNKDALRDKGRYRYPHIVEYHDRVRARASASYNEKAADMPKHKRGRTPKPRAEENDEQSLPKPRKGRPPTINTVSNVSTTALMN